MAKAKLGLKDLSAVENHSLRSAYREKLLEHLFSGLVMKHVWLSGIIQLEILTPQVDDGGYDLVFEMNSIVRHVQLKSTSSDSKVARFNINTGLVEKPGGCVIVIKFDKSTLDFGPFLWFGGAPGKRLPDLSGYPIAKHTKGNSQGVKLQRPKLRVVPSSKFERVGTVSELTKLLFGELPPHKENGT